jgi:hypothetical protein
VGFPEKATLNTHINVKKVLEDLLSEHETNQEPDKEEVKYEEAIAQKPTCNQAIEYLNALQCFVQSISEVPQQICMTLWDVENYVLQQTEKN